ncbi:PP2C family serine/threonine-protein phosphatase [Corynebacterium sp. P8-C1]|uniref:PP2C family protein-serine/threonine phosphatase n=1 Tax=Corynebacterium sp. P8-C1 TaxID=3059082 RepID=UPI00265D4270|nr:protein phosphatase 2C domain-containing protein [Corynebacterium sp. P8-C1]WKK62546.1 protein phosphatase 2C domain-containing protein [Corynebacterium sp. P8-C1]
MTNLKLNFHAASDRGLVRGNNEDSAYAGPHLLLLADGMGGHAAGEVASQLMVEHMEHLDRDPQDADILALLGGAADDANAAISGSIKEHPEQDGMGTTLTALMFNGENMGLIHVGDSRGYRLRDGELTQITEDDTFVQSLVNEGKLKQEDVSSHPQKSLILKAYTGRPVEPHLELLPVRAGDRFMLCSDGLSDPVTHSTMETTLAEGTPEQAAARLIELALRSGGPDNVTVVVADVVDTDDANSPELPTAAAMAGALVTGEEPTHPDTAAGRAAKLMGAQRGDKGTSTSKKEEPASDDEEDHQRRSRTLWPWVIGVLAVALLGLGGLWWFDSARNDTYFVATNDRDEFVIEQGLKSSVFGREMHKPVQNVCINDDNQIRLVDTNSVPGDCHPFALSDLSESTQGRVHNLGTGSYAEVTDQLNRLADEALPACVDDSGAGDGTCREVK